MHSTHRGGARRITPFSFADRLPVLPTESIRDDIQAGQHLLFYLWVIISVPAQLQYIQNGNLFMKMPWNTTENSFQNSKGKNFSHIHWIYWRNGQWSWWIVHYSCTQDEVACSEERRWVTALSISHTLASIENHQVRVTSTVSTFITLIVHPQRRQRLRRLR